MTPGCEPLESRDCPAAWHDPFPGEAVPYSLVRTPAEVWVGALDPGAPRVQVYDRSTGAKVRDYFAGDPDSRSGVVLVPVGVPDGISEGIRSVPDRVWRDLAAAGHPGLQVVGGRVTDHPAHRHARGRLTADGRPFDGLAGVSGPAAVTRDAPAWVVRHELAHDYLPLLGVPIDDEAAAVRLELDWERAWVS